MIHFDIDEVILVKYYLLGKQFTIDDLIRLLEVVPS